MKARNNAPGSSSDEHERKCVFNRLLRDNANHPIDQTTTTTTTASSHQDQNESSSIRNHKASYLELENRRNDADDERPSADPHKQYVAVQQGHDIPLKGLRKPAPQPNIYRGELTT